MARVPPRPASANGWREYEAAESAAEGTPQASSTASDPRRDECRIALEILGMTLHTPQTPPEGKLVRKVYVEAGSNIKDELYLAILFDRAAEKFAIQGFCKDLLDVADNLGRATSTVDINATNDAEKTKAMLMSLHEGVLMVEKQLSSTFSKHGVEKYDPTGDAFDPNDHMALFNVPLAEGKEAGTVAAVTKAGYKLHDRVIRPAEVGVYQ